MQAPRLETARLILDAHQREDFDPLCAMWEDLEVVRHISGRASTKQESWSRLLRYCGLWPILGYGYWAIREKQTGRFVGDLGFADFQRNVNPPLGPYPEAGWALARWAHGQGFATEALAAATEWLVQGGGHAKTFCLITRENTASIRVAEKVGFIQTRTASIDGKVVDVMVRTLRLPNQPPQ